MVNANGSETQNCADLRNTLTAAGALASIAQKVVVFADAGTFDCGANKVTVPSNVTLRGAGPVETFIKGALGNGFGEGLVELSGDSRLERIRVRNNLTGVVGNPTAVADLSGQTGFMALRDVSAEAIANGGTARGVYFDDANCNLLFECTERQLTGVSVVVASAFGAGRRHGVLRFR